MKFMRPDGPRSGGRATVRIAAIQAAHRLRGQSQADGLG